MCKRFGYSYELLTFGVEKILIFSLEPIHTPSINVCNYYTRERMKKHIRNDNNKIHLSLVIYDCLVSPQNAIIDVCVSCNQKVSIGMSACNLFYCILHTQ